MSILPRPALRAVALGLLLAGPPGSAEAADPAAVAARLQARLAGEGIALSWTGVTGDDSRMVLSGVMAAGGKGEAPAPLGDVTLTGIEEKDGAYLIEAALLPDIRVTEEGTTVAATGIRLSGLKLPPEGESDPFWGVVPAEGGSIDSVSVARDGKEIVAFHGLGFVAGRGKDDGPLSFTGTVDRMSADLTTMEDPSSREVLKALGYERVEGRIDMAGSWSPTSGKASIDRYDIKMTDIGTLGITYAFGGYTEQVYRSLRDLGTRIAEASEEERTQLSMEMLGLVQKLLVDGASIRFTDDSLTNRILDYMAAQQGTDRAEFAGQLKGMLPFMLGSLGNPEVAAMVSDAVAAFLDDPKSFEIAVAPPAPLEIGAIASAAMLAPQQLPQQLGLKVEANK